MKDIYRSNSPDSKIEFKFQSPPPTQTPKVIFPTEPKKIENPSLNKDGKHIPKKTVPKGQPTFWPK